MMRLGIFVSFVVVQIHEAIPLTGKHSTREDYPSLMTISAMATKMMTMPISSTFNEISKYFLWGQLVDHADPGIGLGEIDKTNTPRMRNQPLQDFLG